MKVIITGATGFIGTSLLQQCLSTPSITTIFTLTRRPLPADLASHPKITSIIHTDFEHYSDATLAQLAGAEACFWLIGMKTVTADPRRVDVGYSQAAAEAFTRYLQPQLPTGKKFRFVFTSGIVSEKDPSRKLWFLEDGRRSRGEGELQMMLFAGRNEERFEAFVIRPGMVLGKATAMVRMAEWALNWAVVSVDHLVLAMLGLVEIGGTSRIVENKELVARGRAMLLK